MAFLHILIDSLKFDREQHKYPDEIRAENAAANEQLNSGSSIDILSSVVRFTGSGNDTVSNSQLSSALMSKNIVIGKMLLAKQLKIIGAIQYNKNGIRGYSHIAII